MLISNPHSSHASHSATGAGDGDASTPEGVRAALLAMTRHLGEPQRDYVILGEGNTSASVGDGTFWVTGSGRSLNGIEEAGFVRVSVERAMAMLGAGEMGDDAVRAGLIAAKVDGTPEPRPSVETVVHAVCLAQPGVTFVGHTHPAPINMLTCSKRFAEALSGRTFPDEVVVCGPEPLLVPYVDPGLPLAREIQRRLGAFNASHGRAPKTIYLQNHGVIALGGSVKEVENITAMAVKAARIVVGAYAAGGPVFMPPAEVERIHHRADEHYRQRVLERGNG